MSDEGISVTVKLEKKVPVNFYQVYGDVDGGRRRSLGVSQGDIIVQIKDATEKKTYGLSIASLFEAVAAAESMGGG